jgi:hypothetical protein
VQIREIKFKMKKILSYLVISVLLSACASSYQRPTNGDLKNVRRLSVVLVGEPDFKVLDSRATDLGPGVLFGVVGAIANSAITNASDAGKEQQMAAQTAGLSYRESFESELKRLLEESKRFEKIDFHDRLAAPKKDEDAILELTIVEWGIRVVNQQTDQLSPYMVIHITLKDQQGKILWKERESQVGRSAHFLNEYYNQENLLKEAMKTIVKDTTYRIASTLIYS